jgi:hypothetical protein
MIKIGMKIWYLKHDVIHHATVVDAVVGGKCCRRPHLWFTDDRNGRYYVTATSGPIPEKNAFRTKIGLVLHLLFS